MPLPTSITGAGRLLREGELTCEALASAALQRISALQPQLNAFVTVTAEAALAQARALDRELRAGSDRGPLHGIPIAYKDCFDTAGVRTTVGSRLFADRVPRSDAVVVARLAGAGAVMVGKTNMNEFAAGTSGKNAIYGDVRNPWAPDRSAGGSSSGTAAAVASGMALAGAGTDAGGSIRVPAACTGIVGLRPTHGRVSLEGVFPRSYTYDTAGPLGRCVRDCALALQAMTGGNFLHGIDADIKGLRIGIVRDFSFRDADAQVCAAVGAAVAQFAALGAAVQEVGLPALSGSLGYAALVDIMLFEFNRILGAQFRACPHPEEVFGPVVCANLRRATTIREDTYRQALDSHAGGVAAMRAAFAEVDALVTPVLPTSVPLLAAPPEAFDRQRQFMIPFSFAGVPAISLPCGMDANGLPIGMQLVADRAREGLLLRLAQAYEASTGWHTMQWRSTSERGDNS